MNLTTIGIDLAKTSFSLVGMDQHGKVVLRKTLKRAQLLPFIAQCPTCLIGMEACCGAHFWARELIARRGYLRAVVAMAARNARLIWTLMVKQEDYKTLPANR